MCLLKRYSSYSKGLLNIGQLQNTQENRNERITSEFNFEYKFLSPYSYMLNPIENAFSKIKNGVRQD